MEITNDVHQTIKSLEKNLANIFEKDTASFLVETAKNIATKSSIVEEEVAKQLNNIYQK